MKTWDELTPDEKMAYVVMIAVPGMSWPRRAEAMYEKIRRDLASRMDKPR